MDVVGFAAQGGISTATMRAVAPVRFPMLVFLGLSTFERVLQCRSKTSPSASGSTASAASTWRRPRALAAGWPAPTADTFQAAVGSLGLKPRPGQVLLTVAGAISIVNSVLVSVGVAMAVSLLPGLVGVPVLVGLAAMLGAALGQHRHQLRRRQAAPAPFAPDDADGAPASNTP